jgi:hypothetical protein
MVKSVGERFYSGNMPAERLTTTPRKEIKEKKIAEDSSQIEISTFQKQSY